MSKTNNNEENNLLTGGEDSLDEEETIIEKILDEKEKTDTSFVKISRSKVLLIKNLLNNIKESREKLADIFSVFINDQEEEKLTISHSMEEAQKDTTEPGRIIEGVFDGENMIGPDGKKYTIPANYASKSKLVEGDIMKLTISDRGTFIYKQIGPIERKRVVGKLEKTADGNYIVVADGKKWHVLTASVTYYRGNIDDETIILVPQEGESKWAAVENIIHEE